MELRRQRRLSLPSTPLLPTGLVGFAPDPVRENRNGKDSGRFLYLVCGKRCVGIDQKSLKYSSEFNA
jgi:hypothetical protein